MAGYKNLGSTPANKTGHKATRHDGKVVTWPVGGKEWLEEQLGGAKFTQSADVFDTLRFTKTKTPPCTTTFVDGCGVTHTVTVMPDDEVKLLIPMPDETFTRHVNTYKQIVWMFNDSATPEEEMPKEERSCAPAGSTLAECTFTYEEGSIFHNHGIRIHVQAYSRGMESAVTETTSTLANSNDQEKAFWEGDVLKEPSPFLNKYCTLLTDLATGMLALKEVVRDEKKNLDEGPEGSPSYDRAYAKVMCEKDEQQREFNDKAIPLIRRSFLHHDKRGNNVLDRAEASTFFSHVVGNQIPFISTMMKLHLGQGQGIRDNVKGMTEKIFTEYTENKAGRDAAAFKVLDTNLDGTLKLDEVIAAMTLGSAKNAEFLNALGLPDMIHAQ